ncbi:SWF or SNF family helicase [Streptomyces iconiensis]|uniref:SWF or SNF family helicase n=1 Tax=Streptomyces iconiensis TaxID=1384038 RepID=A0ABT6ZV48_9ACTN|nr:SWF or SNF family helicase [Streptomyces iconiensis]MDJ1132933.1 SWF or SNF family helicase [Streptomyces iconiensis]
MSEDRAHGAAEESSTRTPERVFAALPAAQGRGFARTWWGRTWLQALEDTALDGGQLKQGRKYARQGAVGAVSVRPGRITAVVHDPDRTTYRADVLLRELDDDEWDRMLEMVVDEAGHIAALLDRDMPPRLVEDAADVGLELLPGIGDLDPECACGAWDHCPHTTALSYQMARLLDEDPFVLFLMRGRGERELLEALQERSAARAAEGDGGSGTAGRDDGPEGVAAQEAFALGAVLPSLPDRPLPPREPAEIAALDGGTSPAPGLDIDGLTFVAADAASRARRALGEALSPGHASRAVPAPLTEWEDAVRLASALPGRTVSARLAGGCGRTERELEVAVCAWGFGGREALSVLDEGWSPPPGALARARDQLAAAWPAEDGSRPRLRATGARWTAAGTDAQVRYGPDGQWWPYLRKARVWWPAGGPERDPAAALAVAMTGGEDPAEDSAEAVGAGARRDAGQEG